LLAVKKPTTATITDDQRIALALREQMRELEGKIDEI
jgi:hypothetical protein